MLELVTIALLAAIVLMVRGNPMNFGFQLAGFPDDFEPKKQERKPWEDLLMFKKGGGGSAPAPDKNIGKAALLQAETGQQWLSFAKDQFAIGNERQKGIDDLTNQVTNAQLKSMTDSNARADEQWQRYQEVFKPVEDRVVNDANTWDSEERQGERAAEAKADVATNAAAAQQQNQRQMASMGVSPTSGRFAGVDRGNDLTTALASAGAQNNARNTVRREGVAMREGVANMGRGATSTAAQQLGLGLNAGNSAAGNLNAANAQWQGNNAIMGQGYSGAMTGYAGQGATLNSKYGNQIQGWAAENQASSANSAGLMSGIGSIAGMAMSYFSSEELKTDKKPVEGALAAIEQMPVEQWKYKDGVEDGGEHIGPYAEDFHAATGKGDGTSIPVQDAIGVTMGAIQELAQQTRDIGDKVEVLSRKTNPKASRKQARASA